MPRRRSRITEERRVGRPGATSIRTVGPEYNIYDLMTAAALLDPEAPPLNLEPLEAIAQMAAEHPKIVWKALKPILEKLDQAVQAMPQDPFDLGGAADLMDDQQDTSGREEVSPEEVRRRRDARNAKRSERDLAAFENAAPLAAGRPLMVVGTAACALYRSDGRPAMCEAPACEADAWVSVTSSGGGALEVLCAKCDRARHLFHRAYSRVAYVHDATNDGGDTMANAKGHPRRLNPDEFLISLDGAAGDCGASTGDTCDGEESVSSQTNIAGASQAKTHGASSLRRLLETYRALVWIR